MASVGECDKSRVTIARNTEHFAPDQSISQHVHTYRPFSTRTPVLLAFTMALAIYVALIEVILSQSIKADITRTRHNTSVTPQKRYEPTTAMTMSRFLNSSQTTITTGRTTRSLSPEAVNATIQASSLLSEGDGASGKTKYSMASGSQSSQSIHTRSSLSPSTEPTKKPAPSSYSKGSLPTQYGSPSTTLRSGFLHASDPSSKPITTTLSSSTTVGPQASQTLDNPWQTGVPNIYEATINDIVPANLSLLLNAWCPVVSTVWQSCSHPAILPDPAAPSATLTADDSSNFIQPIPGSYEWLLLLSAITDACSVDTSSTSASVSMQMPDRSSGTLLAKRTASSSDVETWISTYLPPTNFHWLNWALSINHRYCSCLQGSSKGPLLLLEGPDPDPSFPSGGAQYSTSEVSPTDLQFIPSVTYHSMSYSTRNPGSSITDSMRTVTITQPPTSSGDERPTSTVFLQNVSPGELASTDYPEALATVLSHPVVTFEETRKVVVPTSLQSDALSILGLTETTAATDSVQVTEKTSTKAYELTKSSSIANSAPSASSVSHTLTPTSTPWPIRPFNEHEKVVNHGFTHFSYFAAIFLAPLLAVLLKIYWETIYTSFRLVEPFERLVGGGSSGEVSLFTQYLSCCISLDTLKICFYGHFNPLFAGIVYVLVTVLVILTASTMTVQGTANCLRSMRYQRCAPVWIVDVTLIRCVEGFLIVCIILLLLLVNKSLKSKRNGNGLSTNPSSIASIASLLNDETLIYDLQSTDPRISSSELETAFHDRRFRLQYHKHHSGIIQYGITESVDCDVNKAKAKHCPGRSKSNSSQLLAWLGIVAPLGKTWTSSIWFSKTVQTTLLDSMQLITSLGLCIVVTIYFYDYKPDSFNAFFQSDTWRPRVALIASASMLDLQWKRLEREVGIMEPYRRLAKGSARPETTILMRLHGTCWSRLFVSSCKLVKYRGTSMWYQTLVSLVTALSEFNIIAVAGVPYSQAQTEISLGVCSWMSIVITGLMTIVMTVTIVWWRCLTVVKLMPRCPDTIGVVFSYLCTSQMARDLSQAGMENLGGNERDALVIAKGKRYCFSKRAGIDGVERWVVDYDNAADDHIA